MERVRWTCWFCCDSHPFFHSAKLLPQTFWQCELCWIKSEQYSSRIVINGHVMWMNQCIVTQFQALAKALSTKQQTQLPAISWQHDYEGHALKRSWYLSTSLYDTFVVAVRKYLIKCHYEICACPAFCILNKAENIHA